MHLGRANAIFAALLGCRRCEQTADRRGSVQKSKNASAREQGNCTPAPAIAAPASIQVNMSIDVACVTPLQQRGGCAFRRVCKRESQALALQSDLRAIEAQPGFHAIMPGCLCVSVCVCVCVCVCVYVCVPCGIKLVSAGAWAPRGVKLGCHCKAAILTRPLQLQAGLHR